MGEKPYLQVPFVLSHAELEQAATSFFDFLTLPQEIKEALWVQCGPEHNNGEFGYRRRGSVEGEDLKEFFHYHPEFDAQMKGNPAYELQKVQKFLAEARKVDAAAADALRETLARFSGEFPNLIDEYFPPSGRRTMLRFLKYEVAGQGNFLAKAHYDAGGCTLALAESAPGLRLGRTEKDLEPVVHQEHTAIFMPGLRLHTVTDARFHPVWHDVVQLSGDTFSTDTARWAIVFFADGVSQERPTGTEIYTPRALAQA